MRNDILTRYCNNETEQIIYNRGYKKEEYIQNNKRIMVLVNRKSGDRIYALDNELCFEDMIKRLKWI